jgi:hypothetical protein
MPVPPSEAVPVWLRILKEGPPGQTQEWIAGLGEDGVDLISPHGTALRVPAGPDVLVTLSALNAADPEMPLLLRNQSVRITCDSEVRNLLPLWLQPTEDAVAGVINMDDAVVDEYVKSGLEASLDHVLEVNGERWWIIKSTPSTSSAAASQLLAIPHAGCSAESLVSPEFAGYEWTETAGMVSGLDWSMVGLMTPAVVAMVEVLDEERASVRLRRFTDPVAAVREWLDGSPYLQGLRSLWGCTDQGTDFVTESLMLLAQTEAQSLERCGPYNDADDDPEDGVSRMGLYDTSAWTFSGSLTAEQWSAALRPGP